MNDWQEDWRTLQTWSEDVFLFAEECLGMKASEPIDALRDVEIPYRDTYGNVRKAKLFDKNGRLTHHDLSFYRQDMFKNQSRKAFRAYQGTRFTWQQTVKLTAYNRALQTFGMDAYDQASRWITTRSGHGTGKTSSTCVIALHFLICYPGSQIGMTANTEQQVQDIFMKEMAVWRSRLPRDMQESVEITSDHVRIEGSEDWFLRAQVARAEKPEALAGLHAKYVLIIVDEASGVAEKVFEVMKGALTGDYFIVMYDSNPTRAEGEFYNSHKPTSRYTKLHFSSRESPIVKEGYIETMEHDYPGSGAEASDEVKVRVDGEFPSTTEMDEKGWMPLFANVRVHFEPEQGQIINRGIIGVDPAGAGKDRTIAGIRDEVYLKEVLNEATSNPKDLARKIETIRDAYNSSSNDIGVDGFGVGAVVVANINTKFGESVNALLTDKPREETKDRFHTWKAELAWKFREWALNGGIIITNNKAAWVKELEKIKYKRDQAGRIMLMDKVTFKKEYGFSPDRFDMAIYTFFKDAPTRQNILHKNDLERIEAERFMQMSTAPRTTSLSSM